LFLNSCAVRQASVPFLVLDLARFRRSLSRPGLISLVNRLER
jgi:hypothetical protein